MRGCIRLRELRRAGQEAPRLRRRLRGPGCDPRDTRVCTTEASSGDFEMDSTKERSIFSTSTGKRRREASEE